MTDRVWLLGHPVRHSISPAMHMAAFSQLGIDAKYELRDVPPAELGTALHSLRRADALGANLTVPHKEIVLKSLDELDRIPGFPSRINVPAKQEMPARAGSSSLQKFRQTHQLHRAEGGNKNDVAAPGWHLT